jgi:GMP synthase-like glutamine amidotransferase
VLILDFGSQDTQLIARRVREADVALELNNAPLNRRDEGDDRDGASAWRRL